MKRVTFYIAFLLIMSFAACKKEKNQPLPTLLNISIAHVVDEKPLLWDSLIYQNAVGEEYSVTRLEYYLSQFRFYRNGNLIYTIDTVIYVDARNANSFQVNKVPAGSYDSLAFFIGVNPERNINGNLPPTPQNVAMEWPVPMGGGYHFIKLEGHWLDDEQQLGYAVHLGTNAALVETGSKANFNVTSSKTNNLVLTMNINEWFRQPQNYSFLNDGSYTMGDTLLMQRIKENGKDVIKVSQ